MEIAEADGVPPRQGPHLDAAAGLGSRPLAGLLLPSLCALWSTSVSLGVSSSTPRGLETRLARAGAWAQRPSPPRPAPGLPPPGPPRSVWNQLGA